MRKILIIDDDPIVIFLQQKILQKSGFKNELQSFKGGEEALDYLAGENLDHEYLILLDINMPEMSGWQVLESLKQMEISQNVYVIMVTSSIDSDDKKKAEKYDYVINFIEKPVSVEICEGIKQYPELKNFFME